jgi:hypothetical protein
MISQSDCGTKYIFSLKLINVFVLMETEVFYSFNLCMGNCYFLHDTKVYFLQS